MPCQLLHNPILYSQIIHSINWPHRPCIMWLHIMELSSPFVYLFTVDAITAITHNYTQVTTSMSSLTSTAVSHNAICWRVAETLFRKSFRGCHVIFVCRIRTSSQVKSDIHVKQAQISMRLINHTQSTQTHRSVVFLKLEEPHVHPYVS